MDGAEAVPGTDDLYGILFGEPLVAGADGSVTVRDLPSGSEWYLLETKAPTGYQPLSRPIHFKLYRDHVDVSGDGADQNMVQGTEQGAGHDENGLPILVVKNTNGYGLPATGGAGTAAFTLLGLLLSAAAAAALLYQRRRRERGST